MEGRYDFSLLRKHNLKGRGRNLQGVYGIPPFILYLGDTLNHFKLWFKFGQYNWWESKKFIDEQEKSSNF